MRGNRPLADSLHDKDGVRNQTMGIVDLAKATVICAGGSALVYSFPKLGQALIISLLGLLWLMYARAAVLSWKRR